MGEEGKRLHEQIFLNTAACTKIQHVGMAFPSTALSFLYFPSLDKPNSVSKQPRHTLKMPFVKSKFF